MEKNYFDRFYLMIACAAGGCVLGSYFGFEGCIIGSCLGIFVGVVVSNKTNDKN
jgi:hypothetical protein